MSFRKATREDAAQIAALVNSAYRGESSKQGWTTEAEFLDGQRTDDEEITKLIEADGSVILLCFQDDEMIGSVHLERTEAGAYLGMFTIKPTLQARGIGKRFLDVAEHTVQAAWGATRIVMAVITRRAELIAFYERRGYRRTGRYEPFPTDIKFGIPKVSDLRFELLEKTLAS